MTDVQSTPDPKPQPLVYWEVVDANILSGLVPDAAGVPGIRIFLEVTILDEDGTTKKINYGFNAWDSLKVGTAMNDMAIHAVETLKSAAESQEAVATESERKRDIGPYL